MKNAKNILIGALVVTVLAMSVGYAALAQTLNITGTAGITSNWNIAFSTISPGTAFGKATNNSAPTLTGTTASFDVNLVSPGDSMTYQIVVLNSGTLDAELSDIIVTDSGSDAIAYTVSGVSKGSVLAAGSTNTVTVKVEYLSSVTAQPATTNRTLNVTLNYAQKVA